MPLTLLLGPANCGKVALLLDRFVEAVESGATPYLVVPTRPDIELAERDLGVRRPALVAGLHAGGRAVLESVGGEDRSGLRGTAAALLGGRLEAWDDAPVFAYGFEDVTGVQLAALRALSGRCAVTVSLPYEAGRPAFVA